MTNTYNSAQDSGDDLFDDGGQHETVATLPVPTTNRQNEEQGFSNFITQPTQPLQTPIKSTSASDQRSSSPSVQVSASSPVPIWTPGARPTHQPVASNRNTLNGGVLASTMAPPGTQFRPPMSANDSQFAQTQTQQADFSDDERRIGDSSENETHSADIKPSTFVRGQNSFSPGAARVAESPQRPGGFKSFATQFTYSSPPKRSAGDDMTSANASSSRPAKVPRQTGPAKVQVEDDDLKLEDIMDYGMTQKVMLMKKVLPEVSIRKMHQALALKRGSYEDALDYIVEQSEKDQRGLQPGSNYQGAKTIDLTSEANDGPVPTVKPSTAKRDIGKSASITQKWSTQASSTKQLPTATARSINEKYTQPQPPKSNGREIETKPKKQGRVLGKRQSQTEQQLNSSPKSSPPRASSLKPSVYERNRRVVDDDDENLEADFTDDEDSGVGGEDQSTPAIDRRLVDFVNSCSKAALLDLSGSSEEVVDKVLQERPFSNVDKIREVTIQTTSTTKTGKTRTTTKKIGDRLVDVSVDMLTGYEAVDDLVLECEKLGQPMARDMQKWGLNAFGASKSAGELAMVDLESAHDSGIGSSSSTPSQDAGSPKGRSKFKLLKQPKSMNSDIKMMDHQVAGLNWLSLLFSNNMSGILADDMGLGKTLQVIAYLTHLYEAQITAGPHLIIVPGSTIENWLREFKTFSPGLRVEPYYGAISERPQRQEEIKQDLQDIHVVVTTYDMAMKPDDSKFLRKVVKPIVCVWDEAHELKNSQSKKYKALIRIPAKQRLMLTGTPLQNNLTEMASLLAFLMPNIFAAREEDLQIIFKNKAKLDTSAGAGSKDSSSKDSDALLSAERISRARSMITPFILRRKKHQVLKDLPKKTSAVEYCNLSGDQATLYSEIENNYREILDRRRRGITNSTGPNDEHTTFTSNKKRKTAADLEKEKDDAATSILTSLRKAAIHPLLFRRHYDDTTLHKIVTAFIKAAPKTHNYNHQLVFEDLSVFTDFEVHRWCLDEKQPSALRKFGLKGQPWLDNSAKARKLVELLKDHATGGHKTLVFSQFTMVMDVLEAALSTAGIAFFRLDGQTKMEQRQDLIDAFHEAPITGEGACSVFMLSTGAGGQGINLACADRVVIFDSGFNPHQDVQAENRAHRVGQTREVVVTRLVSKGTVEEQILRVGEVKVRLDEEVAGGGASAVDLEEGSGSGEKVGKGMVERLLVARLDGKDGDDGAGVKDASSADGVGVDEKTPKSSVEKDLADAYMEGLKGAGLVVKK